MKPFGDSKGLLRCSHSIVLGLALCVLVGALPVYADTAEELKAKIEDQNQKIAALQKEIAQYEADLISIGKNKSTLQNEVNRLDTSRKKLSADIAVTQDKITSANLQIAQLGDQIDDKETRIETGRSGISDSLRSLAELGDQTLIEQYFSDTGVHDVWEDLDQSSILQDKINSEIHSLTDAKQELSDHRDQVAAQKAQLASLQAQLKGQKVVLDQNRQEQAALLAQTKNKESNYQTILAQKQAAKAQFEQQLNQYESQLKFTLDPSKIPAAGSGVLSWPLDPAYMARCANQKNIYGNIYCITQFFGNTAFAKSGAYNGQGHNGIDIGAPEGTKIVAALSGTVIGTGNTDAYPNCYSYGKWVLVKHSNGLTSIYAHLSYIGVAQGDAIPTGGLLGYSGKTGYATGPHLHFGLYASDAVKIVRLGDVKVQTKCANAPVPVSATSGYLNPYAYF
jgi:peptidoglycan DL-endopeptidase CwlO